jgi:hypothetical protein
VADPKDPKAPPAPAAAPTRGGRVKYENRTRIQWVLDHQDGVQIFGQSIDRDIPEAERDPVYTRNPAITLTREQDSRWAPHARAFLDTLVTQGKVDRQELL